MLFGELVLAFIVAVVFSLLLAGLLGWERPGRQGFWPSLLFLFFLLFLTVWAGGTWMTPFGPVVWGVSWLPFFLVGLFIALLLAAIVPPMRPRNRREAMMQAEAEAGAAAMLSTFFWILLVALAIAVVIHYL
jgi:hypothetical protein